MAHLTCDGGWKNQTISPALLAYAARWDQLSQHRLSIEVGGNLKVPFDIALEIAHRGVHDGNDGGHGPQTIRTLRFSSGSLSIASGREPRQVATSFMSFFLLE
jgi:hypothetical protein